MAKLKKLFISHSHRDEPLASAFKATLTKIFQGIQVAFSSDKQVGSGVQGGENWIEWIHQQMLDCQESLLLLTPYSIQKPWPMWEAGAVSGIVLSTRDAGSPGAQAAKRVTPIRFGISQESLPGPFVVTQAFDGTRDEHLSRLLGELMKRYDFEHHTDDAIADVTTGRVP
ncbi:MAG TPA: toll/interleukin-1 receptor domain-containing protein, partial [Polyangiales bacterium]|nr:toll/interleukin-1 receptor domain-containing protein [Polyangiales bacterium]